MKTIKSKKGSAKDISDENNINTELNFINKPLVKLVFITLIVVSVLIVGLYLFQVFSRFKKSTSRDEANSLETANGEIVESNLDQGKLPDVFPKDFPVYENSVLRNNWTTKSQDITGISLVYVSSDKPEEIYSYFLSKLPLFDYNIEVVSDENDIYTLSVEKENLNGFVGIALDKDDTLISVTVGIKED